MFGIWMAVLSSAKLQVGAQFIFNLDEKGLEGREICGNAFYGWGATMFRIWIVILFLAKLQVRASLFSLSDEKGLEGREIYGKAFYS